MDHQRSQLCGSITVSCQNFVSIRSSPSEIGLLRFYDFASLAGKCLTTRTFWGLNPLKLLVVINTPKKRHLSHKRLKSVRRCDLRKKSITRTGQDNK